MPSRSRSLLLSSIAVALAACSSTPPAPATAPATPPRDAATAAVIEHVLAGDHRSAANRARDGFRHPVETLLFFGIKPDMTVVEVWPGAGGWYTEVLAPLLAEHGKLYAAQFAPDPNNAFISASLEEFAAKLRARPDLYGKVSVTALGPGHTEIAPAASADMVVTFRNIHNWMAEGFEREAFLAMFRALKPGGILGVVEHRGNPTNAQDPHATSGYVNEAFAISLIESTGFALIGKSEINANPKDTKDYEQGVWSLPPSYRLGAKDRAKYEAIGESDRFTLKFRKPASAPEGSSASQPAH